MKLSLDFEPHIDFELIGIASGLKPHTLAWQLRHVLPFRWKLSEKIAPGMPPTPHGSIIRFEHCDEYTNAYLYRNKLHKPSSPRALYLLPEVKTFDYLLKIEGETSEHPTSTLTLVIKGSPGVQMAQTLSPSEMKNIINLST